MNRFFKCALAALPALMLASCAEDDLVMDDGLAKNTETRYLMVTLSSANATPGSRAEGDTPATSTDPSIPDLEANGHYNSGTLDENKIKTLEFYFYDSYKNFHSYRAIDISKDTKNDKDGSTDIDPDPLDPGQDNVHGFYHCNVPVELVQGESMPRYVLCIVNSVQGSTYVDKPLADAQSTVLEDYYGSVKTITPDDPDTETNEKIEKSYFGMSNSVYYGMDVVTSKDNQLIMATPFPVEALKTETELNAMNAEQKEAATVEIYVERYAVKVNLDLSNPDTQSTIPGTPIDPYVTGNTEGNVKLVFEPKGWRVNGTEKKFFFLKAFRTQGSSTITPQGEGAGTYGLDFESYETMDKILFNGWNNENHHRSFWARTPGYYSNNYPIVSDDIDKNNANQYDVYYWSYNDCFEFSGQYKYSQYVLETTMKQQRLTGDGMGEQYLPTAAVPSVIMVGQYKVQGAADNADPIDLYAYGKETVTLADGKKEARYVFYTGDDDKEAGNKLGLGNIKEKMVENQTVLLKKKDDGTYVSYGKTDLIDKDNNSTVFSANLEVVHPSKDVRMATTSATVGEASGGGLKVAADVVALQVKAPADYIYFYNSTKDNGDGTFGGYEAITEANIHIANRLLFQNIGGAHMYKDGMAFFFAPIFHWGWYRTASDLRPEVEGGNEVATANPNFGKSMVEWDWTKMRTGDFGLVRNHVYNLKIGGISGLGTGIKDPDEPIVPPADKVGYEVHFHVNIQRWAVLPTQTWNW